MTVNVQPIERDGAYWIAITVDGDELRQRGPEAAAERIRGIARVLTPRG